MHLDTTLPELAEFWVAEMGQGSKLSAQTKAAYEHAAREYVAARLPLVRVGEVTVPVVNGLLTELAASPANAKRARVVIGHMMDMAVNHGAIAQSPVSNSRSVEQAETTARALSADLLDLVHEAVSAWEASWTSGPRRNADLMFDVLDLLLATAARIGEVLALRWSDIDLDFARCTSRPMRRRCSRSDGTSKSPTRWTRCLPVTQARGCHRAISRRGYSRPSPPIPS